MTNAETIRVLCHDHRSLITGRIDEMSERGCVFVSEEKGASPAFGHKAQVLLNLLDEKSGRSLNVQARLGNAQRIEGEWVYRVRWSACPPIFV